MKRKEIIRCKFILFTYILIKDWNNYYELYVVNNILISKRQKQIYLRVRSIRLPLPIMEDTDLWRLKHGQGSQEITNYNLEGIPPATIIVSPVM